MNIGGGDDLLQSGVLSIKLRKSRLAKDVVLSINVQRKFENIKYKPITWVSD